MRRFLLPWVVVLGLAGCVAADDDDVPAPEPRIGPALIGPEDRPARALRPTSYDGVSLVPVVVGLHGYQVDSWALDTFYRLSEAADALGVLLVLPEALDDEEGFSRWNVEQDPLLADDVSYLREVVADATTLWAGDPDRVWVVGHSNGAAMSYVMGCEAADLLAGISPFAGTLQPDAPCAPSRPLSVLHVHGTEDGYEGSATRLGAVEATERFAASAGCELGAAQEGEPLDLIRSLDGAETEVLDYRAGCADGARVSLWTMQGAGHTPAFRGFGEAFLPWLLE